MSKFKNLLVIMVDQGCLYPVLCLPYEGKKGEMGVMLPPLSFYPLCQKDGPCLHMTCFGVSLNFVMRKFGTLPFFLLFFFIFLIFFPDSTCCLHGFSTGKPKAMGGCCMRIPSA